MHGANPARMRYFVEHSIGIVTALVPAIGYERATQVAKEALDSGRGVYEVVLEKGLVTRARLDELLNPESMAGAGGARDGKREAGSGKPEGGSGTRDAGRGMHEKLGGSSSTQ